MELPGKEWKDACQIRKFVELCVAGSGIIIRAIISLSSFRFFGVPGSRLQGQRMKPGARYLIFFTTKSNSHGNI